MLQTELVHTVASTYTKFIFSVLFSVEAVIILQKLELIRNFEDRDKFFSLRSQIRVLCENRSTMSDRDPWKM